MRNIPVFLLTLYFFTFLIGNYQGAYDRIAPQFVFISIINLVSLGYLLYLKTLHEILINIKKSNILLSYTAYLFIAIISLFAAENLSEGIIVLSQYLTFFVSLVCVYQLSKNLNVSFYNVFAVLLLSSIVIECYGVLSYAYDHFIVDGSPYKRNNNLRGYSGNINVVSFSIAAKFPVLMYYMYKSKNRIFLIFISILIFSSSLVIFLLLSRGAFLALILSVFLYIGFMILKDSIKNINKPIIILFSIIASYIFVQAFIDQAVESNAVSERVESIVNLKDESINDRLNYYSHAIQSIALNPILGVGIGNWKFVSIKYDYETMSDYIVPIYVHNDFLHVAAEIGIVGAIFFVLVFFFSMKNSFKIMKQKDFNIGLTLGCMMSVYLIDSMLNFPISRPISHMFLIFLLVASTNIYVND